MKSTQINHVIWRFRMERIEVSTVTRQFKRTFDEGMLNELGKRTRLCQRERTVTPFRLALSLIEVFASPRVPCIADLHRGFNALCEESVRYKPFHNQLAKRGFAQFMRELQSQLLNELAVHAHPPGREAEPLSALPSPALV